MTSMKKLIDLFKTIKQGTVYRPELKSLYERDNSKGKTKADKRFKKL